VFDSVVPLCLVPLFLLPAVWARSPALQVSAALSATYDDNVFQYSPHDESAYLMRSRVGVNPRRFAGVRSLDDLATGLRLMADWRPRVIPRHTTLVGLTVHGHQYLSNPAKSYFSALVRVNQYLAPGSYVGATYLVIPRYLIRNYRDPTQASSYFPCTFTEHLVGIRAHLSVAPWLDMTPILAFELDRYQPPFQDDDTRSLRPGIEFRVVLPGHLQAIGNYEFKTAQEIGTLPFSPRKPVVSLFSEPLSPDLSYHQHTGGAGLARKFGPVEFNLHYDHTWRGYTTSPQQDTSHAGRVDVTNRVSGRLTVRLAPGVSLGAELGQERRFSSSPYRSDGDDVKDYTEHWADLGMRYGATQ
jgi:hypothetical protein